MRYEVVVEIELSNGNTRVRNMIMEGRDLDDSIEEYKIPMNRVTLKHDDGVRIIETNTIKEISTTPLTND